uniref:Protein twisted gastrulation n=2 Tax=Ascaris TaxID=6251 RepID=A0A0M3IQI8_ASCLU
MPPPVISYSQVYFAVFCSPCKDQRCSIAVMIVRQRYVLGIALWSVVCIGLCAGASAVDCSETECGPRVSKCMLLKACNCSITRENILNNSCTCCTECIQCLDKQYTQCCSCFGLCNPDKEAPRMNSYVDKFDQDEEDLIVFDKVAAVNKLGTTYRFPVLQEHQADLREGKEIKKLRDVKGGTNCTVVYLDKCISHEQCSRQCLILGASMLRWFHTGCCECIGHTCLPYGSNTPRCKYCTDFDDDVPSLRQTEL